MDLKKLRKKFIKIKKCKESKIKSPEELARIIHVELGFLLFCLIDDILMDTSSIVFQATYDTYFWKKNLLIISQFILCIGTISLTLYIFRFDSPTKISKFYWLVQIAYSYLLGVQFLGYYLEYSTKYWRQDWVSVFYLLSNLTIPFLTLILILLHFIFIN